MANENVKIIIQEADETTPRGSGTSSDVAYIPGLAVAEAKSKNVPVLCNTVADLEANFGKVPYTMTKYDVDGVGIEHTYNEGNYDKSYIYAKELLNAGMSVYYENIAPEDDVLKNIATVSYFPDATTKNYVTAAGDNVFIYAVQSARKDEEHPLFKFRLKGDKSGVVTVQVDKRFEDTKMTVDVAEITCDLADKFTISRNTIQWTDLDPAELEFATFTIKLAVKYSGKEAAEQFTFAINVVEGNNVTTGTAVMASRIKYLYDNIADRLNVIEDKSEYTIKYITMGGYPSFVEIPQSDGTTAYSLANALIDCAAQRGDAVALIDPVDNPDDSLRCTDKDSTYYKANQYFANVANGSFGSMFMPWGTYTCVTITDITKMSNSMPASFGYLMCMANAIKTSPNWLAMAGVARGGVPNLVKLNTNRILSNVIAEDYQPKYGSEENKISINAITNIKPYGLTLWGNRTLEPVADKGTVALNFLNTRNMVSDIKKLAYSTAKSLMFEQDSDMLWLRFKSGVSPLLEQLKSGAGISDYKLIRGTTKYNGQALTRGEMAAVIKIYPRYAVEYFEITVVMADKDVEVE